MPGPDAHEKEIQKETRGGVPSLLYFKDPRKRHVPRTYDQARGGASVCPLVTATSCHRYHVPTTPGVIPSLPPTQHPCIPPHFTPTSFLTTPLQNLFLPIGTVYKRVLVVPSSSRHQRALAREACTESHTNIAIFVWDSLGLLSQLALKLLRLSLTLACAEALL